MSRRAAPRPSAPPAATRPVTAALTALVAALLAAGALAGCSSEPPGSSSATGSPQSPATPQESPSSGGTPSGGATPSAPALPVATSDPPASAQDVPARMYAVLSDVLDPYREHLPPYQEGTGRKQPVTSGKSLGAWYLNAEWKPEGLIGLVVSRRWPDGWVCLGAYPSCYDVEAPGGVVVRALPAGRRTLSVGYEQPDGDKVIVSAFAAPTLSASDLARVVVDPRLGTR